MSQSPQSKGGNLIGSRRNLHLGVNIMPALSLRRQRRILCASPGSQPALPASSSRNSAIIWLYESTHWYTLIFNCKQPSTQDEQELHLSLFNLAYEYASIFWFSLMAPDGRRITQIVFKNIGLAAKDKELLPSRSPYLDTRHPDLWKQCGELERLIFSHLRPTTHTNVSNCLIASCSTIKKRLKVIDKAYSLRQTSN